MASVRRLWDNCRRVRYLWRLANCVTLMIHLPLESTSRSQCKLAILSEAEILGLFFATFRTRRGDMTKAAILIDGGYFLKRLPRVRPDIDMSNPDEVVRAIEQLVRGHLNQLNNLYHFQNLYRILYRCFYYDAPPYENREHQPVSKRSIDYGKSEVAAFKNRLFDLLRARPSMALRLGEIKRSPDSFWRLKPNAQRRLLNQDISVADLDDSDFAPTLRQKGVDMRIGLDIASITLKRQADTIILVSGDSDFVSAAKLARREGAKFILDPLWQKIPPDLFEHIDRLTSGFPNPRNDVS